ncbi:alpha/beta fold hydrolase [Chitinophaga nivalis]|uniref:Alpha/beta hydrolase n=1 Tax=Chitinophaga nivalis TaxID=2991709 RepID=A0ABT3IPR5_9BACT|nr:alpha/beta hydrolase [Chitinophaga nivalis]MCW3464585.1 alpha/beta hydrolase [Chitinophaga nivalis]MCW3485724.1 alpha/beta hydrolase [Chitinophaga nivalis]
MRQPILLLHGLFGGLSNWKDVVTHFNGTYDVRIPPLPIYDQYRGDPLDYLVGFLENYIEQLNCEKVVLIGNSLGGHVAILYTHRHPEKVAQLILTGSSGLYENTGIGSYPKRGNYAYIRERVAYTFYDPAVATDTLVDEVYRITTNALKCLNIIRTAKSAQRNYVTALLPAITTPVLLLWGEDDKISPPDVAHDFLRLLPNAELVMIPHCGHAPMMERPDIFNRETERFLATAIPA